MKYFSKAFFYFYKTVLVDFTENKNEDSAGAIKDAEILLELIEKKDFLKKPVNLQLVKMASERLEKAKQKTFSNLIGQSTLA